MATILGLSGSLRKASFNTALLREAKACAPPEVTVEIASIAGIPLYDGDEEAAHGIPAAVSELKERIVAADGLLLVSPEYNNSIPGVFKNAIDWLSRPPKDIDRVFGGRPVGLIGATQGQGGTRLAQQAWLPVLRTLGTQLWTGRQLNVAAAYQAFDAEGRLVDEKSRKLLADFMSGFAAFVVHERMRG